MSTDQQQDSPARQRQDIQALADRSGYHILRWYEDHGLTGTESGNRKDFQRLLADAKSKTFCAVLLSEQSRMSREDIFDAMVHWKLLRDAGVKIVTCQRGELDFSNLGGVITAIVDQYGAREESLRLADRVISGKRLAISRGQKQGGPPLGYDREILDETGRVVRRVAATERFRRRIVAGRRCCGKFRSLHDEGGVVCENAHEPLITPALFNRAQRMLPRNRRPARTSRPGRYLLTGLVFLADGRRLRGCAINPQ